MSDNTDNKKVVIEEIVEEEEEEIEELDTAAYFSRQKKQQRIMMVGDDDEEENDDDDEEGDDDDGEEGNFSNMMDANLLNQLLQQMTFVGGGGDDEDDDGEGGGAMPNQQDPFAAMLSAMMSGMMGGQGLGGFMGGDDEGEEDGEEDDDENGGGNGGGGGMDITRMMNQMMFAPESMQPAIEELDGLIQAWLQNEENIPLDGCDENDEKKLEFQRVSDIHASVKDMCQIYATKQFSDSLDELVETYNKIQSYGPLPDSIATQFAGDDENGGGLGGAPNMDFLSGGNMEQLGQNDNGCATQ